MSEREELIEILHQTATADRVKNVPLHHVPVVAAKVAEVADAILAAGYRKPRAITTAEELDGLHMVVVRSKGGSIANIVNGRAYVFGYEASVPASTLALPATVIYEPTP